MFLTFQHLLFNNVVAKINTANNTAAVYFEAFEAVAPDAEDFEAVDFEAVVVDKELSLLSEVPFIFILKKKKNSIIKPTFFKLGNTLLPKLSK